MPRGKATFKGADLSRAIRAARNAGVEVGRYEINKDGTIVIIPGKPGEASGEQATVTPDDELERWRRQTKNAHHA